MALTKIPGELFSVGDLDISDVGTISLDAIQGDADSNTSITFSGSDVITIATGGSNRLTIGDGALSPVTDNQIDLGTSSLEFKDAYFDGTVTSDAFAGPLTGDVTGNVSGTAATVTGAAQSAITSLGTLTTLTVDNVIVNGTTIGHTSDTDLMTLADGSLTVAGATTITVTDNSDALTLISTDTDANAAPYLNFYRNPGEAGADSDQLGQITFVGKNDANTPADVDYARIITQIKDATDGSEDGRLAINTVVGGSMYSRIDITEGETVINNESQDLDFRVESNDSANMLLVDGGNNKVLVEANNTASVTDSASMVAASAFEINGNAGEGSDILRFFAMADATGNYGIEVSNSGGNAQYDLCINPINKGAVIIGGTTLAAHGNTDDLQIGDNTGNRGIGIHSANDGTGAIFFADGDSSLSGQLEYSHASDHLAIITGGNQRLRIDAHGVKFGTDSADANALDDYEEGTWNPGIISGGSTNPTGGGYVSIQGNYVKIGRQVWVNFYVGRSWTNSPNGQIHINGLPFTPTDDNDNIAHVPIVTYNMDGAGCTFAAPALGGTTLLLYQQGSGAWASQDWQSHATSPIYLAGQISYFV